MIVQCSNIFSDKTAAYKNPLEDIPCSMPYTLSIVKIDLLTVIEYNLDN